VRHQPRKVIPEYRPPVAKASGGLYSGLPPVSKDQTKETVPAQGREMGLRYFNCQEKGHLAKFCPQAKKKNQLGE